MLACWYGERVRNQNSYRINPMKKLFRIRARRVLCRGLRFRCAALTIQEVDGSPRVNSPTLIKVTNGTLLTGKLCTDYHQRWRRVRRAGLNTQVQYNAAGSFYGISGFTSDGTNVTAGSGICVRPCPRFITSIDDNERQ